MTYQIYCYDTLGLQIEEICVLMASLIFSASPFASTSPINVSSSAIPHMSFPPMRQQRHLHFYTNSSVSSLPEPASYRILLFHLSVGVYQVVSCTYHYILIRTSSSDSLIASTHSEHFLVGSRGSCLLFYYSLYIHRSV